MEPGLTALVVEDDPYVRRAVRNVLANEFGRVLDSIRRSCGRGFVRAGGGSTFILALPAVELDQPAHIA